MQDWCDWRDRFIAAASQHKTPEAVDVFINKELGENKSWETFVKKQPHYTEITQLGRSEPLEKLSSLPVLASEEQKLAHGAAMLEHGVHKRLIDAQAQMKSLISSWSFAFE